MDSLLFFGVDQYIFKTGEKMKTQGRVQGTSTKSTVSVWSYLKNSLTCSSVWLKKQSNFLAPVAQLDRVPDYESVGRRFESCRARQ